jgi:hypothetical protein
MYLGRSCSHFQAFPLQLKSKSGKETAIKKSKVIDNLASKIAKTSDARLQRGI